jgi:hypothetical protein
VEAENDAFELKGRGNALLWEQVAGLAKAGKHMEAENADPSFMPFTVWCDTMKDVVANGQGNLISFDGANDGFEKTLKQMQMVTTHPIQPEVFVINYNELAFAPEDRKC